MEEALKPKRPWAYMAATALFIAFFLGVGIFSWRVFSYYRDVRDGGAIPGVSYASTQATTDRLIALTRAQGVGSGVLATSDDPSFGPVDAPLTIVAFTDYGCPYSQEESYVFEAIAQNTSNVRVIMRDFPLVDLHPGADRAAIAAECASEQGKYREMYRVLHRHTGAFTEEDLVGYARDVALDETAFTRCMNSGYYDREIEEDIADGISAGVTGTPTLFINGVKIEGAVPYGIVYDLAQAFTN